MKKGRHGYKIIDTNIILRALLQDDKELSSEAQEILKRDKVILYPLVIAEVVWVLTSFYQYKLDEITFLVDFFSHDSFIIEDKDIVLSALQHMMESRLSFIDSYLLFQSKQKKIPLETFDKQFRKALK